MLLLTIVVVIGLPLVVVGVTLLGPIGWIVAAVVVPLAAIAAILLVARRVGEEHDEDRRR